MRSHEQTAGLSRQLHDRLDELQRLAQKMDSLWRMQSLRESTSKRDIWKHKVEQVSEECDALGAALDKHGHRERRCGHQLLIAFKRPLIGPCTRESSSQNLQCFTYGATCYHISHTYVSSTSSKIRLNSQGYGDGIISNPCSFSRDPHSAADCCLFVPGNA